jgi:precorrin-8X/cobalt-precorrin-8 methylmutase
MDYLRDPEAIYAQSFGIIRAEADFAHLPTDAEPVAVRIILACGVIEAARDLVISPDFVSAARRAQGPIIVDVEMVRQGIIPRFLKDREVICTLNDPRAKALGVAQHTTRSAAAVELWRAHLADAIVVIGNAPTALFRLLELIDDGAPKPAVIAGFPVGFVGAAESKDELIRDPRGIAYAAIKGRMGGSAMAAAVINALLEMGT